MIFKSCGWPSEVKEVGGGTSPANRTERKIAHAVLRCCPCVFRCRKSVGISRDENDDDDGGGGGGGGGSDDDGDGASVSTIITTATATPVIALKLDQSNDTVYVVLTWVDTVADDFQTRREKDKEKKR